MKKRIFAVVITLLLVLISGSCVGCVYTSAKISEDLNKYDDIYALEDGRYLFVEAGTVGISTSLKSKEKQYISDFSPEAYDLNPHVIGEYIYISQNMSPYIDKFNTKVTKINADTLEIVDEKEYAFNFNCMTSDGESLLFIMCSNKNQRGLTYKIDTNLQATPIEGEYKIAADEPIVFTKAHKAQFSGNKGIITVSDEDFDYLCTAVIENNELKICKVCSIVEPNAQILSTDYDTQLTYIYNSTSTAADMFRYFSQMKKVEVNQSNLFKADAPAQSDLENFVIDNSDNNLININIEGVGQYDYPPNGYGEFIEVNGNYYYFCVSLLRGVFLYRMKDNLKSPRLIVKKKQFECAAYEEISTKVFCAGDDEIFFHVTRDTNTRGARKHIVSGFVSVKGI